MPALTLGLAAHTSDPIEVEPGVWEITSRIFTAKSDGRRSLVSESTQRWQVDPNTGQITMIQNLRAKA